MIEFAGGIYTNSVAILSDAVHDLGDALSLGVAYRLEKLSEKKRDKTFTYGYGRFSLLSALITGVILLSGSILIIIESVKRIFVAVNPDSDGMIVLALLGIFFNSIAYYRMHHGEKMSEKMVSLHLLEDIAGWVVVFIGAILIKYFNLVILDPIMSIFISAFILIRVGRNLQKVSTIFLQGKPDKMNINKFKDEVLSIQGVLSVHDVHSWSLDGTNNIMTIHLKVPDNVSMDEIISIKKRTKEFARNFNSRHVTVEIELDSENCELEEC